MSTIYKIKQEVHGRDTGIAPGEAECYISIQVMYKVIYFTYSINKAML